MSAEWFMFGCGFVVGAALAAAATIWLPAMAGRAAMLTSLRASLEDANATISRLSAEKHARDVTLRRVIEAAEGVHKGKNP